MQYTLVSTADATRVYGTRMIACLYVLLGLIGFIPSDSLNPLHSDGVVARYLLNLIAVDPVHNAVHVLIGATGVWAAGSIRMARRWGLAVGGALLLLFCVGMLQAAVEGFPPDQVLLLLTLNSPGHMLHAVTGGLLVFLGLFNAAD